eukprot:6469823-Pyramimonas_sp.AAC.1
MASSSCQHPLRGLTSISGLARRCPFPSGRSDLLRLSVGVRHGAHLASLHGVRALASRVDSRADAVLPGVGLGLLCPRGGPGRAVAPWSA